MSYSFEGDEGRPDDPVPVGAACGACGGPIYFERCTDVTGSGHEWAIAGECQRCGARHSHTCPECGQTDPLAARSTDELEPVDDRLVEAADGILAWITGVHAQADAHRRDLWERLGARIVWRVLRVFIFGWRGPR